MRKLGVLLTLFLATPAWADLDNPFSITEQDGSPVVYIYQLKVDNGTLTDNLDGTASITNGGGASIGGAVTNGTANSILFVNPNAILSQDNTTLNFDDVNNIFTLTSPNVDGIRSYSGGAGLYAGYGIGRTATEGGMYIAGSTNQFSTGAVAGDITVRADATSGKLFLGSGPTANMTIKDIYSIQGSPHINGNVKHTISADAASVTDILDVVSRDSTSVLRVTRDKAVRVRNAYNLPTADGSAGQTLKTNGSGVTTFSDTTSSFGITIDGGGSAITTGLKGYLEIPFGMTITGWTLLGDVSGSIVIDVWKDNYANFPPTVADTIAGSEKPTISAATKGRDLSLSSWTTSVTTGDVIAFSVDSASTITRANLIIRGNKT